MAGQPEESHLSIVPESPKAGVTSEPSVANRTVTFSAVILEAPHRQTLVKTVLKQLLHVNSEDWILTELLESTDNKDELNTSDTLYSDVSFFPFTTLFRDRMKPM